MTVLAPLDSAIISKGYCWRCLLLQENRGEDLLSRHLIEGTWFMEELLDARTVTTVGGTNVTFRRHLDGM